MKYNLKLLKNTLVGLVLAAGAFACTDAVDDYYLATDANTQDGTILQYVQSHPEYSKFAQLLEETGMSGLLAGGDNRLYTLWLPSDDTMPAEVLTMSDSMKRVLVQNHISSTMFYSRNFSRLSRITMLNAKTLDLTQDMGDGGIQYPDVPVDPGTDPEGPTDPDLPIDPGQPVTASRVDEGTPSEPGTPEEPDEPQLSLSGYLLDGVDVNRVDLLCDNGIVHEVGGWLMPRVDLYSWIQSLGDDYSIFRDSLLNRNVRTFDRENSEVIGVDESGQIIYDSVFIITNDILDKVDLANENLRFTCFIPDNNCVREALQEIELRVRAAGYPLDEEDSFEVYDTNYSTWMKWILTAAFHSGKRYYDPLVDTTFTSIGGAQLRTRYQRVSDSLSFSNGRAYLLKKSRVPYNIYLSNVAFCPYTIRKAAGGAGASSAFDRDAFAKYGWNESKRLWYIQFEKIPFEYYFYSHTYSDKMGIDSLYVMPGHYQLYLYLGRDWQDSDKANTCDKASIYVDDEFVADIEGITEGAFDKTTRGGLIAEDLVLTPPYRMRKVTIKLDESLPNSSPAVRLTIGNVTFVPTEDNY